MPFTPARLSDEITCKWPHGMPPTYSKISNDVDVALVFANDYTSLLNVLPTILELQYAQVQTVLCCDDFGDLYDLINDTGAIMLAFDAEISIIAGVLFGTVQRNNQISQLRSQVGLVKHLHDALQEDLSLLQDDLETAATVQREFMSTEVQEVHGVSFSSLWRPASVVSGDMYDITQLDEDHVAIFIADAIGHGISAAMLAMMLTRTLAANRYNSKTGNFTQPHEILTHLNCALLERTSESARFATAAYGILNCKTNQLTYAGAGHPPLLLSKYGQDPILLESEGPLLGVFEHDDFPQSTIELSLGDTLLMYSDGFEFALGDNHYKENEIPTYLKTMHEFCNQSNSDVLHSINTYVQHTTAGTAHDDMTMICIRAKTLPSSIRIAA